MPPTASLVSHKSRQNSKRSRALCGLPAVLSSFCSPSPACISTGVWPLRSRPVHAFSAAEVTVLPSSPDIMQGKHAWFLSRCITQSLQRSPPPYTFLGTTQRRALAMGFRSRSLPTCFQTKRQCRLGQVYELLTNLGLHRMPELFLVWSCT